MKVLIIGSGAREHTLVKACLASPTVTTTLAAPGNGGIEQEGVYCFPVQGEDIEGIKNLVQQEEVQFVIIGPEAPMSLGLVDALEKMGIPSYGPNKKAAQLESSKAFSKYFLKKYGIPTAEGESFTEIAKAQAYLIQQKMPIVLKASGLAAGKGVIIAETLEEAQKTLTGMMLEGQFGDAGKVVLIEEYLQGPETSIIAIVCARNYHLLPTSQDHKRIGENDTGPNTGGVGAYAPADCVDAPLQEYINSHIIKPTLEGLAQEGIDFRGTLYTGLMLTSEGPKVLEYNTRFGDPETQVLFPLWEGDPIAVLYACAHGKLPKEPLKLKPGYAMAVVHTAEGYPGKYAKGDTIKLPSSLPEGTAIIHAGTRLGADGALQTSGGRVLSVVATASTLREAADKAYALSEKIKFRGQYFRKDIGARQLQV